MKSKIILSLVLLFLTVAFISKIPTAEENVSNTQLQPGSSNPDNEFIIGAMYNAYDQVNNYTNIKDTFHMNTWHIYTGPYEGWYELGTTNLDPNDTIGGDTVEYGPNVEQSISNNNNAELRTIMDRPYIEYLAFGQRSDYQCEDLQENVDTLWFYSYYNSADNDSTINDTTDDSQFGDGQRVKLCLPSLSSAGYIVDSLKANREQANKLWNYWMNDDTYKWYVKPRIRIDSNFVDTNPNDTVCRIDIVDWNGNAVKKVGILGRHFRYDGTNYDGRYLMEYNFEPLDADLIVDPKKGDSICPGPAKVFTSWRDETIETDYKVYWYGTCEMWIDYVRVENYPSVLLHSGELDYAIQREVRWALRGYNQNRPNNFYIEEFEFNTLSCIKRVNEIINSYSGGKLSLMVNFQYDLFRVHIPDVWHYNKPLNKDFIKRFLIDSAGLKYIVNVCYPLSGDSSKSGNLELNNSRHPTTLYSGGYSKNDGILSYPESPDDYDTWLQRRFDTVMVGGNIFNYVMKLNDSLIKESNDLRLINLQQAHLWWSPGRKLKEPTIQESELMSCLAISYGAKGLLYFCYNSIYPDFSGDYGRGIMDEDWSFRHDNVYGQDKAKKYGEMNEKYAIWGSYLMSFDDANRKSYIYRLSNERNALIQNTYFLTARTFKPGSGTPTCSPLDTLGINPHPDSQQSLTYDCPEDTYLQVALFNNPNDNYQYFMIANRRCSPYIDSTSNDNNGGRRFVRVLFAANRTEFSGYNNWNIIDVEHESKVVAKFDKTKAQNIELGWYMPGEGRLYKIAPVIK